MVWKAGWGPGNKAEGVQDGCTWLHAAICMAGWPISFKTVAAYEWPEKQ